MARPLCQFRGPMAPRDRRRYHPAACSAANPGLARRWGKPVIRRVARIADGWIPQLSPDASGRATFLRMREYAEEAGRNPDDIGLDGRVAARGDDVEGWAESESRGQEIGATHVSVTMMGYRVRDVDDHLNRLRRLQEALGDKSVAAGGQGASGE